MSKDLNEKKNEGVTDNKKINRMLFGIIITLGIVIIILLVFIFAKTSKDKKADTKTTENSTEKNTSVEEITTQSDVSTDIATTEDSSLTGGEVFATAEIGNQWEGNGSFFGQLNVCVVNGTSENVNNWVVEIPISDNMEIDTQWNCVVKTNSGKLIITGVEYNSNIIANTKAEGIGIILKTSNKADFDSIDKNPLVSFGESTATDASSTDAK